MFLFLTDEEDCDDGWVWVWVWVGSKEEETGRRIVGRVGLWVGLGRREVRVVAVVEMKRDRL